MKAGVKSLRSLRLTCTSNYHCTIPCSQKHITIFNTLNQRWIQCRRAPPFENFYGCIFENFDSITRINFIVINMQCLQYVFYSLLSLQKHRVCVKGHQNYLHTSKTILCWDCAPRFLNFWIRHC